MRYDKLDILVDLMDRGGCDIPVKVHVVDVVYMYVKKNKPILIS